MRHIEENNSQFIKINKINQKYSLYEPLFPELATRATENIVQLF